ncbi:mechanosensitive ion channel [Chloroflexi bacterium TSY]|nr:mechanosensitive ion channel [Chloroflexi bacterium TSY]
MNITDGFFQTTVLPAIIRIIIALIIFAIGRRVARFARSTLSLALTKTTLTESIVTLFTVLAYNGILIFGGLVALAVLGIPVATLVTTAGVILVLLGIALQESLSSFAATILFMLFKPYEVDELIETNGIVGRVKEIQLFNTVLLQADQKMVTLPNAKIRDDAIINYSRMGILRVDLIVGIGYEDDLQKAKQILTQLVEADERVLADPAPKIVVKELGASSVDIGVWPFANTSDHWSVKCDLIEQIKLRFDEEGISIPYPQRDVHLFQNGSIIHTRDY